MKRWLIVAPETPSKLDRASYEEARIGSWDSRILLSPKSVEVGDQALLWRRGRASGIVAIGKVTSLVEKERRPFGPVRNFKGESRRVIRPPEVIKEAHLSLDHYCFSRPVTPERLTEMGFADLATMAHKPPNPISTFKTVEVDFSDRQWSDLIAATHEEDVSPEWPATWAIPEGGLVDRRKLTSIYGGSTNNRVGASARTPNVFAFISTSLKDGRKGYAWEGDLLICPGHPEPWIRVTSENLSILSHHWRGYPIRVFEARAQKCVYIGEFVIDETKPVEEWLSDTRTTTGLLRNRETREVKIPLFRLRQISGLSFQQDRDALFDAKREIDLRVDAISSSYEGRDSSEVAQQIAAALDHPEVIRQFSSIDISSNVRGTFSAALRIQELRRAVAELKSLLSSGVNQEAQYQEWCEQHSWAFGNSYAFRDELRRISVGDTVDILMSSTLNRLRDIIELKRPDKKVLLFDSTHKSWYWSQQVSQAIGQCHRYLDKLHEQASLLVPDHPDLAAYHPRATVVIGRSDEWEPAQQRALHGLNSRLHGVSIITYDHLLAKAEATLDTVSSPAQK
ncbi:Shedu anti-phage system protein SduA domain-containing protein [Spirillospora sp. CA-108201]